MYGPLWRRLPGAPPVKTALALLLAAAAGGFLWYVVFPWLAPHVPLDGGILGR